MASSDGQCGSAATKYLLVLVGGDGIEPPTLSV
jgi:hypothetical protein